MEEGEVAVLVEGALIVNIHSVIDQSEERVLVGKSPRLRCTSLRQIVYVCVVYT